MVERIVPTFHPVGAKPTGKERPMPKKMRKEASGNTDGVQIGEAIYADPQKAKTVAAVTNG